MTLQELDNLLPNGLHDAEVKSLKLDYVARTAEFDMDVWVGDLHSKDLDVREKYRPALLVLSGLQFCTIEPPDTKYPFADAEAVTIERGSMDGLKLPPTIPLPEGLPENSFTNWLFVQEWNAFIYVCAFDARLDWKDEPVGEPK